MAAGWDRLLTGFALLAAMGVASATFAQGKRGWVDPPVAAGANQGAAQWPDEASRRPMPQQGTAGPVASEIKPSRPPVTEPAVARVEPERVRPSAAKRERERERAAAAREARAEARLAVREARVERQRVASERRRLAARAVENRRIRVAEPYGTSADVEMMRLRTYELPDGRRVQVLTRPPEQRFFNYSYR